MGGGGLGFRGRRLGVRIEGRLGGVEWDALARFWRSRSRVRSRGSHLGLEFCSSSYDVLLREGGAVDIHLGCDVIAWLES